MYETGPSGPFLPFSLTWIKPRKPLVFSVTVGKAAVARLTGQNVRGLTTLKLEKVDSVHEGAAAPSHLPDGNVASDNRRVGVGD